MWPSAQFPADLVTFTEEILNGKLYFLCSACDENIIVVLYRKIVQPNIRLTFQQYSFSLTELNRNSHSKNAVFKNFAISPILKNVCERLLLTKTESFCRRTCYNSISEEICIWWKQKTIPELYKSNIIWKPS